MRRAVSPAMLLLAGLLVGTPALAADAEDAEFLHALVVVDTADPDLERTVTIDKDRLCSFLEYEIPQPRRHVTVLQGNEATSRRILEYYRTLDVAPTHSLLFYYSGHGAWAEDEGHLLALQSRGDQILRSEIEKAMLEKRARLTILLTDTCSDVIRRRELPRAAASAAEPSYPDPDIYRSLFFRHRGVVNLTAASQGQIAVGNNEIGGAFTSALVGLLESGHRGMVDRDGDRIVSWREFADQLVRKTGENSRRIESSQWQTPHVFSLATASSQPVPRSQWRLGIGPAEYPGKGVLIKQVYWHSPAEWAGFREGDILLEIDGRAIQTTDDFARSVEAAGNRPVQLRCTVGDPASGKTRPITVRLRSAR